MSANITVLESIDQVDAPWIQAVLQQNYQQVQVRHVHLEPIGAGNVSETVRAQLTYDFRPAGAPEAVVIKFRPSAPQVHAHGLASGAYHREIGAYRAITPTAACRIPHLFHVDGDETNINLVIEDLTCAAPGDQIAGCGVAEAEAVLLQQARLHATFYPQHAQQAPTWPIRLDEVADYWTDKMKVGAQLAASRYADVLSAEELATIRAGAELVRDWHFLPQDRLTLTHGDPRVDNVLFNSGPAGLEAVLIDWQVTGLRNPMYDVGYFLSGSIDAAVRRPAQDRLIDGYVAQFEEIRPGVYTAERAREDLATQMLSGLIITTAAAAVLPDNDVVKRLIVTLLQRNIAAAIDWNSLEATRTRAGRSAVSSRMDPS